MEDSTNNKSPMDLIIAAVVVLIVIVMIVMKASEIQKENQKPRAEVISNH